MVFVRNDAAGLHDGVLGLVDDVVGCIGRPGHDHALLRLRCCGGKRDERQEAEEEVVEELHGGWVRMYWRLRLRLR